jgi:glutathione S-transferase
VLNRHLEGREYLVGDKCTYVDLAFIPWNYFMPFLMKDQELDTAKEFPHFHAWNERLKARPAVKKTFEIKDEETKKFSDH